MHGVLNLVLKCCSDINEENGNTFFLHFIGEYSCIVKSNEFFIICGSSFGLKVSRIALLRKSLQLDSKTDLITNGLTFVFLLIYASFRRLHVCMD